MTFSGVEWKRRIWSSFHSPQTHFFWFRANWQILDVFWVVYNLKKAVYSDWICMSLHSIPRKTGVNTCVLVDYSSCQLQPKHYVTCGINTETKRIKLFAFCVCFEAWDSRFAEEPDQEDDDERTDSPHHSAWNQGTHQHLTQGRELAVGLVHRGCIPSGF